ncbi:Stage III sporulation protein J [Ligilactobacillus acidipiscis DSM 15836]|uniref:Membrane protein insertase YidC n=1 Tax=Ligilactobacillus acidipiscis DSM 15836 TaxID=1423716 RepID=A0ABR5PL50_9LACO|nr:membrane protein insertase YidC [Ligilactobacillus acidipiscis]KRM29389.1 Stage III sporulation protein J [Ligilactobacillus acidipiscis DSM 15836]GAW64862.1 preprotein translocase subunit YidC [Ligilactobacillus acidipiscis]GEN20928.1 membrane protein insertase YidC [Ligilactobacillus acidipiscis]
MKKGKKALALFGALSLVLVLSACSTDPVNSQSTGFWDHYIIWNFVRAIKALSNLFGGSYGWGIIIFTIIVRIIILPLMFYQMKSSRKTMDLQPQLKELQAKYPDRDQDSMRAMQEEQRKLYAEAGVNPVAGFLPLLVQMPVLLALYQAIFRSQELKTGTFMWMQLGDKDPYFVLPVLAAIFTFATSKLSMMSQPDTGQKGMTAAMTYGMPLMIFITALNVPAALSLYWVITNAFSVGQTLLINNPFKINRERAEKEQAKKDRERDLKKAKKRALRNRKK